MERWKCHNPIHPSSDPSTSSASPLLHRLRQTVYGSSQPYASGNAFCLRASVESSAHVLPRLGASRHVNEDAFPVLALHAQCLTPGIAQACVVVHT
ncbi:hypothetical protein NDU88_003155 [Pleurodeles waltl]|uniref:Uncharacterized protein n=1 Tax=Pleurodeles waltl TaxID=8319 RepID=A0AAV7W638_PLEWA|nr:hypothetical protein NDU88_003155 [Pleurodeles waltl]